MKKRTRGATVVLAAWVALTASQSGADTGRLILSSGGQIAGAWAPGVAGEAMRWQAAFARGPFEFPWSEVSNATFSTTAEPTLASGGFQFELVGGGLMTGDLVDVSDEWLTVDVAWLADAEPTRVKLRRERVVRINNLDGDGELIYSGPSEMASWKPREAANWKLAESGLETREANASIWSDIGLEDRVRIELEIGWRSADFTFEVGVPEKVRREPSAAENLGLRRRILLAVPGQQASQTSTAGASSAFKLEAVDGSLLALREMKSVADLATVTKDLAPEGQIELVLYLDQEAGRLVVTRPTGAVLAELNVNGKDAKPAGGVRLSNRKGGVSLGGLRVTQWDGCLPSVFGEDEPRIETTDGQFLPAEITGFDAESNAFQLRPTSEAAPSADEDPLVSVKSEEVRSITLGARDVTTDAPALIALHDGTRLRGAAGEVIGVKLRFQAAALEEPIDLPLVALRGVRSLDAAKSDTKPPRDSVRLVTPASNVKGALTGAAADGEASCLVFRPFGSRTEAPVLNGVSGRLVFREPKPTQSTKSKGRRATVRAANRRPPGILGAIAAALNAPVAPRAAVGTPTPNAARPDLAQVTAIAYLRAGDKLPCEVKSIDAEGVHLRSPFATTEFIRNEKVKAIELVTDGVDGRMTKERRDQLLMLPRMQRDSPPTHLLVSTKGDYLRCRLISLNDAAATVEVRLEERQIERSRIARIIWLDPPVEEEADAGAVTPPADAPDGLRVQAVRSDGVRLSFELASFESVEGDEDPTPHRLVGSSGVIGDCQAPIDQIDELLLGDQIEIAAKDLSYQRWVMTKALEPREDPQGEGGEGGDPAVASPLIGEPAPDVHLPWARGEEVVEDEPFTVASHRGKVLVLDFWASWCGPCLQAMPIVDRLGDELAEDGVRVVAVNLQESPIEVAAALERLAIDPAVALDRDGVAAQRYEVTGIPRTVVIDREGKVSHVFVGSGGGLEERLREALESVIAE